MKIRFFIVMALVAILSNCTTQPKNQNNMKKDVIITV